MLKFLAIGKKIRSLFGGKIDEGTIESLERIFYEADLGAALSRELTEKVRQLLKANPKMTPDELLGCIKKELISSLLLDPSLFRTGHPHVILIEGVNGNGKTTTVAKLGKLYKDQGKKVLVAAADTFRAAAIEQLETWALKAGLEIVKGMPNSDPAAVVFDAIQAAKARGYDVVIADTAGRLHTKTDLMRELEKIHRVSGKAHAGAPHETLLVLDATIGQNGVDQAKIFHQFTPLTGLILTKLDGTAKGGTALAIQKQLKIPIRYIGVGEKIDDLKPFEPTDFVNSLFE